jgi:peptidoglycan/LPS O-acetylase OafA/YrhL
MNGAVAEKEQIKWLDTLKGIACWTVFLGHFENDFPYIPGLQKLYECFPILKFITEETTALNVFYIISAYLIASRYLDSNENTVSKIGRSVLKRYLRLSIPIFVMNLLIIIIQRMGYGYGDRYGMFHSTYTFPEAVWNAFVDCIFFGSDYFNTNMWMINELFFGYIFTMIICIVLNEMKTLTGNIILVILTVVLWLEGCYISVFVFGIILYRLIDGRALDKPVMFTVIGSGLLILGIVVSSFSRTIVLRLPQSYPELPFRLWWLYCWIAAMMIVSGIALNLYVIRFLEIGCLHKLGKICFPVFLFHRIWFASFGALAYSYGFAQNGDKGKGSLAALVVSFILTLISALLYLFFLEPLINKLTERFLTVSFNAKSSQ